MHACTNEHRKNPKTNLTSKILSSGQAPETCVPRTFLGACRSAGVLRSAETAEAPRAPGNAHMQTALSKKGTPWLVATLAHKGVLPLKRFVFQCAIFFYKYAYSLPRKDMHLCIL
eukprot:1158948-Pelagomonas_calceolata.AAC.2